MLKVLIVEDEWVVSEELKEIIQNLNCEVIGQVDNAKDTLAILDEVTPQVILIDVRLQGLIDGIDLGRLMMKKYPCQLVFLTSLSDSNSLKRARELTSVEIVFKPFEAPDIQRIISKYTHVGFIEKRRLL